MIAPTSPPGTRRGRRRIQFGVRGLVVLVACSALLLMIGRALWDRRPENAPWRALRALRSSDDAERERGASELQSLLVLGSLPPEQADDVIAELVVALRDVNPRVRENAATSLLFAVNSAPRLFARVPLAVAVVAGLVEALRDEDSGVRAPAALALANLYSDVAGPRTHRPPLPRDTDRFVDALAETLGDPDPVVRRWAFDALAAIAPRLDRPPPGPLVAALGSANAETREGAVRAVVEFSRGIDEILPTLLGILERDDAPWVRMSCASALGKVRPSPAAVPALMEALRSPERSARYSAAALLSRIGPRASAAVPALLPLLEEGFQPTSSTEMEAPTSADPAVAAILALGAIAPGTEMADRAEGALTRLLRSPGYPWRQVEAARALERFGPGSPSGRPASTAGPP